MTLEALRKDMVAAMKAKEKQRRMQCLRWYQQ